MKINERRKLTDEELWCKCQKGESITCEDLGIHPNIAKCGIMVACGFRTFFSDGINYYDVYGNPASYKDIKLYDLW